MSDTRNPVIGALEDARQRSNFPKFGDQAGTTPATIVEYTHIADKGGGMRAYGFCIAYWDKDYEPWVTWRLIQHEDGTWFPEHGTYHQTIDAAARQYAKRIKDERG